MSEWLKSEFAELFGDQSNEGTEMTESTEEQGHFWWYCEDELALGCSIPAALRAQENIKNGVENTVKCGKCFGYPKVRMVLQEGVGAV
jgi:hypothetical protein